MEKKFRVLRTSGLRARPLDAREGPARVEANARLTASTSMVLLMLLLAEIATVLMSPRRVLTLHDTIGLILLPLVALKLGSTTWKMAGYYLRSVGYRALGPPAWFFRLLGPVIGVLEYFDLNRPSIV